jgi:hypothetical protein
MTSPLEMIILYERVADSARIAEEQRRASKRARQANTAYSRPGSQASASSRSLKPTRISTILRPTSR